MAIAAATRLKWSDIKDDDEFNVDDDFAGLVKIEGDIKTTTQYEAAGSVKVITRTKIHKRQEKISRVAVERKLRLLKDKEKKVMNPGEECWIELPKSMRKLADEDNDNDNDTFFDRDVNIGCPSTKKEFVREKFSVLKKLDKTTEPCSDERDDEEEGLRLDNEEKIERYQAPKGKSSDQREDATVRVTNLSEETQEEDLRELFGKVGEISRVYLAKNKETNSSKGFAFITYNDRSMAEQAIRKLDRFGYDNLLLKVEWSKASAKPPTNY